MKDVERILRVDHAGEFGAINIYKAQLIVSRFLYKDIVSQLEEMLAHEKIHFETFNRILINRSVRPCHAIYFWGVGGFILGFFTALVSRKAIWVCTDSIESTVLHHLEGQLAFLAEIDIEVYAAVSSIKSDEESHQQIGKANGSNFFLYKSIFGIVKCATEFAIWLSTKL